VRVLYVRSGAIALVFWLATGSNHVALLVMSSAALVSGNSGFARMKEFLPLVARMGLARTLNESWPPAPGAAGEVLGRSAVGLFIGWMQ
jgi:hypothetical protein